LPELPPEIKAEQAVETFIASFKVNGKDRQRELTFKEKQRRSVGRTGENDLSIEDTSVSKMHAALVLNTEKQLMVADTGSTNGTFINDKRIAYGRAFPISGGDRVKFGNIEVDFQYVPREVEITETEQAAENLVSDETFSASQRDIQTVAFNSNEDVSVKTEFLPPSNGAENVQPKAIAEQPENIRPKETLAETKFVEIKPEKEIKAETPGTSTGTKDRINYDFSSED
jgi:pSer/pThr/pTyr-binding forkhead associated (FHA) protein